MAQSIDINSLREKLLFEINHSNPEILELFYNFIQVVKNSTQKEKLNSKVHPLAEFAGILSYEEGQEMIDYINNEFNTIEGEW